MRAGIAGLLVAAVLGGCGSSGEKQGLTAAQSRALIAQLETARSSAAAGNVPATQATVNRFRAAVARLRRSGALDDATARSLRIGAARLLQRVQSDGAPPAQPETEPAPLPPGQAKKKHDDKKKDKHGKGKKHGKGGHD